MRDGKWKILAKLDLPKYQNIHDGNIEAIRSATLSEFELYDLSQDLSESTNVANRYPEQLAALTRKLKQSYHELLEDSYVWKRASP
jgi:arylsulfatase A